MNMTQNPYAQFGSPSYAGGPGGGGAGGFDQFPTPTRTSVMAIMSLVMSLLCFIPGLSVLAIIFGGAAILFISSSKGRLGGLGLAIAGVLIGLCFTVIWLFFLVGAMSVMKQLDTALIGPSSKMMTALESKDYATARQYFDPALDTAVTDAQLGQFVSAYQAELGSFKSMPQSFIEYIFAFGPVGQQMQGYQGGNNEIPIPTTFDSGVAILFVRFPNGANVQVQPGGMLPKTSNFGILVGPGKDLWLLDPTTMKPMDHSAAGSGSGGAGDGSGAGDAEPKKEPAEEPAEEPVGAGGGGF